MPASAKLTGCTLSPGYGSGTAFVYHSGATPLVVQRTLRPAEIPQEQQRFRNAVADARRELHDVRERVLVEIGEAESDIIGAHLLLLEDSGFMARVESRIETERINAEQALELEADSVAVKIRDSKSDVLRERAHDVTDVKNRLLKHLGHGSGQALAQLPPSTVIVARELLPSDTLNLDRSHVAGIALEYGAPHGHTAIIARAMGIPAVGGIDDLLAKVRDGDSIFVDGELGELLVNPEASQAQAFTRSRGDYDRDLSQLTGDEWKECVTRDGQRVTLLANIGRPAEVDQVHRHHLDGIGLFRTEYLLLESSALPSFETQRAAYRSILDRLQGRALTIRTFDLGGDKRLPFVAGSVSRGQGIGMRGLRFSLLESTMLRDQVRAIIEAIAPGDDVALLLPMVSSAEEIESALELVDRVASSLGRERPRVGAMIETPAAVFEVDEILRLVDFVSVGTNDLAQLMLGGERRDAGSLPDEAVLQPAMLRALRQVAARALTLSRPVTVCGEAAGEPLSAAVLLGLGFRTLSMSPARAARVRAAIRYHSASTLTELASEVLAFGSRARVARRLRDALGL